MQLDNPVQTKVEQVAPPPEHPVHDKGESTPSAYVTAAADAYAPQEKPQNALLKPGDQRTGLISRIQDGLPEPIKKDIDAALNDGLTDSANGKWTDKTKGEWKKLVDDLKAAGTSPEDIADFLNELGAGINKTNASKGIENVVGMILKSDGTGKADVFMTINGPKISKLQNALDAAQGQESDTVLKAGTLGGPPEQHI